MTDLLAQSIATPVTVILLSQGASASADSVLRYLAANSFPFPVVRVEIANNRTWQDWPDATATRAAETATANGVSPKPSLARSLHEALKHVSTPYVYVAPPGFVPVSSGLIRAIASLHRNRGAVSVGGAIVCHHAPSAKAAPVGSGIEGQSWQIAFSPQVIGERRALRRLHHTANRYRPFTAAIHRTPALAQAANAIATADIDDWFSEEILIALELALRGRILHVSNATIAIGPRTSFDHYCNPANAYNRVLSRAWFDRIAPIPQLLAADLRKHDGVVSASRPFEFLRALLAWWKSPWSRMPELINGAEEEVRNALGRTFFTIMGNGVVPAVPQGHGMAALIEQLRRAPYTTPPVERLQQDIEDYWFFRTEAEKAVPDDGQALCRA